MVLTLFRNNLGEMVANCGLNQGRLYIEDSMVR
jgi:hypothetical protein